jgi:GNAT superfamily N-acetyltransferase
MTIRAATVADIDAIFEVHQSSVRQLCERDYCPQQIAMWLDGRSPDVYLEAIRKQALWVAVGDAMAGFVEVDGAEVSKLFVAGAYAFHGVGAQLLQVALERIAAGGAPSAYLESTVTAVKFYERHGFRTVGHGFFSRGNSAVRIEIVKMERAFGAPPAA